MIINIEKAKKKTWQRAILTRSRLDTFAAEVLNFCVRDGNRCVHLAIATRFFFSKDKSFKTRYMITRSIFF